MKNDWLLRMRLDIVSVEQKHKRGVESVARGGDPKDYARAKFLVDQCEKERQTIAVSKAGGRRRISEFHLAAIQKFLLQRPNAAKSNAAKSNAAKSIVTELAL